MLRVELTLLADDDLEQIYIWGAERFGEAIADETASALRNRLARLAEFPGSGALADGRTDGVRKLSSGAHVIFYRVEPDRILVARILHKRMDWPTVLAGGGRD